MFFEYHQNLYVVCSYIDYKDKTVKSSLQGQSVSIECYMISRMTVSPTYVSRNDVEKHIEKFKSYTIPDIEKANLVLNKDGLLAYMIRCYTQNPSQKTLIVLDPNYNPYQVGQRITLDTASLQRIPNKLKIEIKK